MSSFFTTLFAVLGLAVFVAASLLDLAAGFARLDDLLAEAACAFAFDFFTILRTEFKVFTKFLSDAQTPALFFFQCDHATLAVDVLFFGKRGFAIERELQLNGKRFHFDILHIFFNRLTQFF